MFDKCSIGVCLLGALALGAVSPAVAETDYLWPRFSIDAGAYDISTTDKITIEGKLGLGNEKINLATDIGLPDSKTLLSAKFDWAFAEHHSLQFGYFSLDRNGEKSLQRDVEIGGEVFPVGATASVGFKSQVLEAGYTWWFKRSENFGMGGTLGLVYLKVDVNASATATVAGGGGTVSREASANTDLPVPVIGLALKGRPAKRLVLYGNANFLPSVTVGDYKGEAGVFSVGGYFYFWGPLALGASYDGQYFKADVTKTAWNGSFDLT